MARSSFYVQSSVYGAFFFPALLQQGVLLKLIGGFFCNEGTGVWLGAAFVIAEERWYHIRPLLNDNLGIHIQRKPTDSFPSPLFKSLTLMSVEDAQHLSGPVNMWVTLPRQQIPNQPDEAGKTKDDTSNVLLAQWGLSSRIQLSYETPLGVFPLLE